MSQGTVSDPGKYYKYIADTLQQVIDGELGDGPELDRTLDELAAVIPKVGLSKTQFNRILDLIVDPPEETVYKLAQRIKMVSLLLCFDLIDIGTLFKILGSFQVEGYDDAQEEILYVPRKIQIGLADWLVAHFYEIEWSAKLLRLLPFVFNLLSIGYIRPQICLFTVYLLAVSKTIDPKYSYTYFLSDCKLEDLVDLMDKDVNVLPLALFISNELRRDRDLAEDSWTMSLSYKLANACASSRKGGRPKFGHADQYQMADAVSRWQAAGETGSPSQLRAYYQTVQFLNWKYSEMPARTKRSRGLHEPHLGQRLGTSTADFLGSIELGDYVNIDAYCNDLAGAKMPRQLTTLLTYLAHLDSTQSMVQPMPANLEYILGYGALVSQVYPLVDTLLKMNSGELDKSIATFLHLKNGAIEVTPDFDQIFAGVLVLTKHSLELPHTIELLLSGEVATTREERSTLHFWDFVPFLPLSGWDSFEPIFKYLSSLDDGEEFPHYLSAMLSTWLIKLHPDSPQTHWDCINCILERALHTKEVPDLELLQFAQKVPYEKIRANNLVLRPSATYSLYFSDNPVLVDFVCRHVTFCKKYYREYGSAQLQAETVAAGADRQRTTLHEGLKEIQNSFVMDLCNIIWRDKAFDKNERSTAKGFLLPEQFVHKLYKLRFYYYESTGNDQDSGMIKRTYDLFYAPAFASILTGVIRNIEDQQNATVRLAGPLNYDEFETLAGEANSGWIANPELVGSYDRFRVTALNRLSDLGFTGFSDLLFSSLKSLSKTRSEMSS